MLCCPSGTARRNASSQDMQYNINGTGRVVGVEHMQTMEEFGLCRYLFLESFGDG
eukprot:m.445679 g.445679  ORF g.445679 m.445679 type:complete len:55 (-) comp145038_c0_seq1:23-187(-)